MKIFQLIDWLTKIFKLNNKSKIILLILLPLPIFSQNNAAFWLGKKATEGPQIVTDNLVLHYDIGNASSYSGTGTTVTDLSTTGRNATLVNSPTYTTAFGGELVFDDVNDYATISGTSPLNSLTNFTFEIVAAINSASEYDGLFLKTSTPAWVDGFGCYYQDNLLKCFVNNYASPVVSFNIGANEPVRHYTFVYNGSQLRLYVDGSLVSTTNYVSAISNNSSNLLLFSGLASGEVGFFMGGDFYIFRLYSDALTDAEVLSNFNATKTRFGL